MQQLTFLILAFYSYQFVSSATMESCDSKIYCQGELLDTIQRNKLYNDSKTFVDLIQVNPSSVTLANFNQLMSTTSNNPSSEDLRQFVGQNFKSEGELEDWSPPDYTSDPAFLKRIDNKDIKSFATQLVSIWPKLAKKVKSEVKENPDRHSLIPMPNGFIIPGGRFKEIYYWDSYWIVKGLVLSEMTETVRGMLENFLFMVQRYGFVPNGSRVYYLNRSQPPMLSLMVGLYMDSTGDSEWLAKNIDVLEQEVKWWLTNRTIVVEKGGVKYELAHYSVQSGTPRPESYSEDLRTCANHIDDKEDCYKNLKSGAESGWDFSTRWFFNPDGSTGTNITYINTPRVIPVDLNSILCKAFKEISKFHFLLGNVEKSAVWAEKAASWQKAIEQVLYDREDGIWYDFDNALSQPRKVFYPSNFAPLWTGTFDTSLKVKYGELAAKYFESNAVSYRGGIPTSLIDSGEQWDLPNAWPPLQEIVILGLHFSGATKAQEIAELFAERWIEANIIGYQDNSEMFEKYDAITPGKYGGGGEYTVQSGFGWTNGVALSLINKFYATGVAGVTGNHHRHARS